jgi:hypothetical protein
MINDMLHQPRWSLCDPATGSLALVAAHGWSPVVIGTWESAEQAMQGGQGLGIGGEPEILERSAFLEEVINHGVGGDRALSAAVFCCHQSGFAPWNVSRDRGRVPHGHRCQRPVRHLPVKQPRQEPATQMAGIRDMGLTLMRRPNGWPSGPNRDSTPSRHSAS